ncbi:MAG: hypothetical protein ABIB43_05440 [archaeon]
MDDDGEEDAKWMIPLIHKAIFTGVVILIIVFFAFFFFFNELKTDNAEQHAFFNRLIYSTNALAYYDAEIDRSYLGRIDLDKLTTENLEKTINYPENRYFGANITLRGKESVFYHKNIYENLVPLARAGLRGAGSSNIMIRQFIVSYTENDLLTKSPLRIEIVRARS